MGTQHHDLPAFERNQRAPRRDEDGDDGNGAQSPHATRVCRGSPWAGPAEASRTAARPSAALGACSLGERAKPGQ